MKTGRGGKLLRDQRLLGRPGAPHSIGSRVRVPSSATQTVLTTALSGASPCSKRIEAIAPALFQWCAAVTFAVSCRLRSKDLIADASGDWSPRRIQLDEIFICFADHPVASGPLGLIEPEVGPLLCDVQLLPVRG